MKIKNNRRNKRFILDEIDVNGKMVFASEVKIIDISGSGISMKIDRRLNVGQKYMLKLEDKKETISVRGTIIWCLLKETRKLDNDDVMPVYLVGMEFSDLSNDAVNELLTFINFNKKAEKSVQVFCEHRVSIRFHLMTHETAILHLPTTYKVNKISMSGMLIECDQSLELEAVVPMEISLYGDKPVQFEGRIASCLMTDNESGVRYDIGIEFLSLSDEGREMLVRFIQHCEAQETGTKKSDGHDAGPDSEAGTDNIKSYLRRIKG